MSLSKEQEKKTNCNLYIGSDTNKIKIHGAIQHRKKSHQCQFCNYHFSSLQNLKRHLKSTNCIANAQLHKNARVENIVEISDDTNNSAVTPYSKKYLCTLCSKSFTRSDTLKRHQKKPCRRVRTGAAVTEIKLKTDLPSTSSNNSDTILNSNKNQDNTNNHNIDSNDGETQNKFEKLLKRGEFITFETAFKSRLKSYKILNKYDVHNPIEYLNSKADLLKYLIRRELKTNNCIKVNVRFEVEHVNIVGDIQLKNFKTTNIPIYQETNLEKYKKKTYNKLLQEMSEFEGKKSGWSVHKVHSLEVRINKYCPLRGSGYIKLPKEIAARKAVTLIKNRDEKCFEYSILAHLTKNSKKLKQYSLLEHDLNFSCVSSPTPLDEIPTFERINNISINVFGIGENNKIYPLKIVDEELPTHNDLLFVKDKNGRYHYYNIKNFERLLGPQISKRKGKKCICKRCFTFYYKDRDGVNRLKKHRKLCGTKSQVRIEMPKPGENVIKFKNVEHSLRLPIVVYADFECLLKNDVSNTPAQNTNKLQSHELLSFCVYVKTCNLNEKEANKLPKEPYVYRKKSNDDDVGAEFIRYIAKIANIVKIIYSKYDPMNPLTPWEKNEFKKSEVCYLCHRNFTSKNYKVRDHSHITGDYRGAAHNICNLNNRKPRILPIFFHNLAYDSHFIIPKLNTVPGLVHVIPNTEEKYISFTKKIGNIKCRFLDSFRFMSSSVATLASNLPQHEFKETFKHNNISQKHFKLLLRKGVYCYDYINNLEKLNETKLPSQDNFYNVLTESHVTDDDYNHAKNVWNTFNIKTLGEYNDLYMKTDVLILADVFEHFRTLCLKNYNLDPSYYYTAPGLTWDAGLKFTRIELELLRNYDMLLMFEEAVRGGITQCVKRFAEANNPYLSDYDTALLTSYLSLLDSNNLYGKAMCEPLPYGGFEWVDVSKVGNIMDLDDDGEHGYVFEVDIVYPCSLHYKHSDLPFLPERKIPAGPASGLPKLLTTLEDKFRYTGHYRLIKQAIAYGLQVKKIHRGIKFLQSRWLAPYIEWNTKLRQEANNEFEEDFFKLMNNSFYGKTVENIRNRLNMKIVVTVDELQKLINKCSFLDRTIFAEQVVAVHMAKEGIRMLKPIYVGMCVLDLSKIVMYDFYYGVLKKRYGDKIKLLYMDTDAYLIEVQTPDFYEDMKGMSNHFDLSNFPKSHPAKCYSRKNKLVVGKFKDETHGVPIKKYCGLRPKMYCIEVDNTCIKKIKGVKSYAVKMKIQMKDFLYTLLWNHIRYVSYRTIISNRHNVSTVQCSKVALSPFDDKRVMTGSFTTLPYGHVSIRPVNYSRDQDLD